MSAINSLNSLLTAYDRQAERFSSLEPRRRVALFFGTLSFISGVAALIIFGAMFAGIFVPFLSSEMPFYLQSIAAILLLTLIIIIAGNIRIYMVSSLRRVNEDVFDGPIMAWAITFVITFIYMVITYYFGSLMFNVNTTFRFRISDVYYMNWIVGLGSLFVLGVLAALHKYPVIKYFDTYREMVHMWWVKQIDEHSEFFVKRRNIDLIRKWDQSEATDEAIEAYTTIEDWSIKERDFVKTGLYRTDDLISFTSRYSLKIDVDEHTVVGGYIHARGRKQSKIFRSNSNRKRRIQIGSSNAPTDIFAGSMIKCAVDPKIGDLRIQLRWVSVDYGFTEGWKLYKVKQEYLPYDVFMREFSMEERIPGIIHIVHQIQQEWGYNVSLSLVKGQLSVLVENGNYMGNGPLVTSVKNDMAIRETGSLIFGIRDVIRLLETPDKKQLNDF